MSFLISFFRYKEWEEIDSDEEDDKGIKYVDSYKYPIDGDYLWDILVVSNTSNRFQFCYVITYLWCIIVVLLIYFKTVCN